MLRLAQIALYTAAMLALGWLLWQIVPPFVDWLDGTFGKVPVGVTMFVIWAAAAIWVYRVHRRHPEWSINYRRQDSGRFLEPRDP